MSREAATRVSLVSAIAIEPYGGQSTPVPPVASPPQPHFQRRIESRIAARNGKVVDPPHARGVLYPRPRWRIPIIAGTDSSRGELHVGKEMSLRWNGYCHTTLTPTAVRKCESRQDNVLSAFPTSYPAGAATFSDPMFCRPASGRLPRCV